MPTTTFGFATRAALAGAAALATGANASAHEIKISFLHFNDMYEIAAVDGAGGFAQLAAVLKREEAKNPHSIVTFGGALVGPAALASRAKNAPMIDLANAAGIDVAVFGQPDFAQGTEALRQHIAESKFHWLDSNVVDADGKTPLGLRKIAFRIVEDEMDIKVDFLGLVAPDAAPAMPRIKFLPVIEAAREAVTALKAEGAHMIVALTSQPADDDRALIAAVPEIDMVLGGRDRERLNASVNKIPLVKTSMSGEDLVKIDSLINAHGQLRTLRNSVNRYDTKGVAGDPEIAALVAKWTEIAQGRAPK